MGSHWLCCCPCFVTLISVGMAGIVPGPHIDWRWTGDSAKKCLTKCWFYKQKKPFRHFLCSFVKPIGRLPQVSWNKHIRYGAQKARKGTSTQHQSSIGSSNSDHCTRPRKVGILERKISSAGGSRGLNLLTLSWSAMASSFALLGYGREIKV